MKAEGVGVFLGKINYLSIALNLDYSCKCHRDHAKKIVTNGAF